MSAKAPPNVRCGDRAGDGVSTAGFPQRIFYSGLLLADQVGTVLVLCLEVHAAKSCAVLITLQRMSICTGLAQTFCKGSLVLVITGGQDLSRPNPPNYQQGMHQKRQRWGRLTQNVSIKIRWNRTNLTNIKQFKDISSHPSYSSNEDAARHKPSQTVTKCPAPPSQDAETLSVNCMDVYFGRNPGRQLESAAKPSSMTAM
ncbi:hypothetical protein IF1G_08684 [Cordyceps javanica]|uniref:Uncharacterized protein n=1 Tax=Cordyceps javanica TaxID=43265 RepID=A0A545UTI7_9HYPO|nr:hypothetical protein IF1G_08684 [Cordyceps javanica]